MTQMSEMAAPPSLPYVHLGAEYAAECPPPLNILVFDLYDECCGCLICFTGTTTFFDKLNTLGIVGLFFGVVKVAPVDI